MKEGELWGWIDGDVMFDTYSRFHNDKMEIVEKECYAKSLANK